MIEFKSLSRERFLNEYWQKKPVVLRQGLPLTHLPLTADELAGLALDDTMESRLVIETPGVAPGWQLHRGPFKEKTFAALPKTHWTLLVQGVDRVLPEVAALWDHFDFIPSWRLDDVMISYAVQQGSVGPHFDHYDVFLYQAQGQRQWALTTQQCQQDNHVSGLDLRIMAQFEVEETHVLEPGDILYLPAHVGHHGVSLSDECMTYSFGYRSYPAEELLDSFCDFLAEQGNSNLFYRDPNWCHVKNTSDLPSQAWHEAQTTLKHFLDDKQRLSTWFGCYVTRLDAAAEPQLPLPLDAEEDPGCEGLMAALRLGSPLIRDGTCRMAYMVEDHRLFINGCEWPIEGMEATFVQYVANHRQLHPTKMLSWLEQEHHQAFLYALFQEQWLQFGP